MALSFIPVLAATAPGTVAPAMPVTDGEHGGLVHVLSVVLARITVDAKSNEISAN